MMLSMHYVMLINDTNFISLQYHFHACIGRQCSPGQFRCADKHSCISASKTCDLSIDCPDASDEKYTLCGTLVYVCFV